MSAADDLKALLCGEGSIDPERVRTKYALGRGGRELRDRPRVIVSAGNGRVEATRWARGGAWEVLAAAYVAEASGWDVRRKASADTIEAAADLIPKMLAEVTGEQVGRGEDVPVGCTGRSVRADTTRSGTIIVHDGRPCGVHGVNGGERVPS